MESSRYFDFYLGSLYSLSIILTAHPSTVFERVICIVLFRIFLTVRLTQQARDPPDYHRVLRTRCDAHNRLCRIQVTRYHVIYRSRYLTHCITHHLVTLYRSLLRCVRCIDLSDDHSSRHDHPRDIYGHSDIAYRGSLYRDICTREDPRL